MWWSILPAYKVLQHGALSCALAADHSDLRQVQVTGLTDGAEGILQLVDQRDQILHATVSHGAFRRRDSANGEKEREIEREREKEEEGGMWRCYISPGYRGAC